MPLISRAGFMGRGKHRTFTGTTTLNWREARCYSLACSSGAGDVLLPDARTMPTGGPIMILQNLGPVSPLSVKDNAGNLITSLPTGQLVELYLVSNSSQAGNWMGRQRGVGTGSGSVVQSRLFVASGAATPATLSVYTPATNTWAAGTSAPNQHYQGAAMTIGGKSYLVGDYPLTAASLKNDELDAATGTWTNRNAAPFQAGRTCGAGSARRMFGEIYGGDTFVNAARFTPGGAGSWASVSALPIAKARCAAVALEGQDKVLIFGGDPVPTPNLMRNVVTDTYWSIANLPTAFRHSIAGFQVNGLVYACGGRAETPSIVRYQNVDSYDPATDTWTSRAALSVGARWDGAGVGANAAGFYLAGQDNADVASNACIRYQQDTWASIGNMNVTRVGIQGHGAAMP